MPRVVVHNPCSRTRTARTSSRRGGRPSAASSIRFRAHLEGSLPNEQINGDGHWTGMEPIHPRASRSRPTVDRQAAPKAAAVRRRRDVSHYGGIPAHEEQTRPARWASPTTSAGAGVEGRHPIVNIPGCRRSPTTRRRRCSTSCSSLGRGGLAPMIPLDGRLRPNALRADRSRSCNRGGFRDGNFAPSTATTTAASSSSAARPGGEVQRAAARAG